MAYNLNYTKNIKPKLITYKNNSLEPRRDLFDKKLIDTRFNKINVNFIFFVLIL